MPTLGGDDLGCLRDRDGAVGEYSGITQVYRTAELGTHLAKGFRDLWEERLLFDCTIVVENQSFQLHKGLLIAMSPYFRSMFTSGFEEAGKSQVELKGVTPVGFSIVIVFLYTSEISISEHTVQDIMEAAAHLQIPCVLDFCIEFLQHVITTINCFEYLRLADMYGHVAGQSGILDFIAKNCLLIKEREEFWNLPYECFSQILQNDDLGVSSEADVLRIALKWVQHDLERREDFLLKLLLPVRLPLIPEEDIFGQLKKIETLSTYTQVYEYVQCNRSPARDGDISNSPRSSFRRSYCTESAIFCVKYTRSEGEGNPCCLVRGQSPPQLTERVPLENLPKSLENCTATVVDNYVFVSGGNIVGQRLTSTEMYRFDMFTQKWMQMASMGVGRSLHGAAGLQNKMIIVGGHVTTDISLPRGDSTDSVEVYRVRENVWQTMNPFPYKVCNLQACTVKNKMYTCGGTVDIEPRPRINSYRLHMYDDVNDKWIERSSMHAKKQWHVMHALRGQIYVFGGVSSQDAEFIPHANLNFQFANMAEVYDPEVNQWTVLAFPSHMQAVQALQRPMWGSFHIGNTLYFVARKKLIVYNTDTGVWRLRDCEQADVGELAMVRVPADCL